MVWWFSDNESRVAEIADVNSNEYGKAGNPVSGNSINLQMPEIPHRLALWVNHFLGKV